MKFDAESPEQVAIHEAGHFIVADELGLQVKYITNVLDTQNGRRGYVHVPFYNSSNEEIFECETDWDTRLKRLACFYAGVEAQLKHSPGSNQSLIIEWQHREEILLATNFAVEICMEKLNISPNDDDAATQQKLDQAVRDVTKCQREHARKIIRDRWKDVKTLAAALNPPCTLTAEEARLAVEQAN